jgi:hypothetical protein
MLGDVGKLFQRASNSGRLLVQNAAGLRRRA